MGQRECVKFQPELPGVLITTLKRLRWSRGSVLAFGTQVRGFKPGRSSQIFQGEEILSTPSFGREVKPFVPCRAFANVYAWKSQLSVEIASHFSPK